MDQEVGDLMTVVASVSRAVGTALDPTAIFERAAGVLEASMRWRAFEWALGDDEARLQSGRSISEAKADGAHAVTLTGTDHPIGHLAVTPVEGRGFTDAERALLDLAGTQIAGALERARLFQEVMQLERLKSDFISRVSHELRTPITIIHGFLDTLIAHDATIEPEQRRHMLERSQAATDRLRGLIEELLILSRLEAGVLSPSSGDVEVAAVMANVRAGSIEPAQVLLDSPTGATLTTDGELLGRALGLVVDNAIKYGSTAEVRAIPPAATGGAWVFEVRDRGTGFADDVRDTAFEMFTRSQRSTSVAGLGVGLPIARTLVEVLDGDIEIDHQHVGVGAVVRITLHAG